MRSKIEDFPFPFKDPVYRYSNNSVPMEIPVCFEITPAYLQEIHFKRQLLQEYPQRCYQAFSYTMEAQWEIVELLLDQMIHYYPDSFRYDRRGNQCTFSNLLTDESYDFIFGDATSLPLEPLDFFGRHVQEDLILMMQRDGDLFLDAGQLCFPANWSLQFNLGMHFLQIHTPIPGFFDDGLAEKIRRFLLGIETGQPWIRRNWSLSAGSQLDTSLETFHLWGQNRKRVTRDNAGELVHLRVEVQKLFRLPRSNGILFTIHTHLLSLQELTSNPAWARQFHSVLKELPDYITEYKGLSLFKDIVIQYLEDVLHKGGDV